jgi:hypothetical protein
MVLRFQCSELQLLNAQPFLACARSWVGGWRGGLTKNSQIFNPIDITSNRSLRILTTCEREGVPGARCAI